MSHYQVVIVGGGLAGLTSAYLLHQSGIKVLVVEKGHYPQHKVCGEYISNEVVPFLKRYELYPSDYQPAQINQFQLTSTSGKSADLPLRLGGFGISRYALDAHLYRKLRDRGVEIQTESKVSEIKFEENEFSVLIKDKGNVTADYVIGSYGKRSTLDQQLKRGFMNQRSPYIGVKYHIKTDFPGDKIALHNFQDGYCGISKVEDETFNLCYLSARKNLKNHGDIASMEKAVLYQNPFLKDLFTHSDFIFDKPLVINEISFSDKSLVDHHILMAGDTSGLITPLCGNGMAMAIRAGKLLAEVMITNQADPVHRDKIERDYTQVWTSNFRDRLQVGRTIQRLFGSKTMSNVTVQLARTFPSVALRLVGQTHGQPF